MQHGECPSPVDNKNSLTVRKNPIADASMDDESSAEGISRGIFNCAFVERETASFEQRNLLIERAPEDHIFRLLKCKPGVPVSSLFKTSICGAKATEHARAEVFCSVFPPLYHRATSPHSVQEKWPPVSAIVTRILRRWP